MLAPTHEAGDRLPHPLVRILAAGKGREGMEQYMEWLEAPSVPPEDQGE